MRTYSAKASDIQRKWFVVDMDGKVLGRCASRIASILRGKHTPRYTPSMDTGDFVVVVNAAKLKLTGNKWEDKKYYSFSWAGFPGGLKTKTAKQLREKHPEDVVVHAVRRMLPRNALGRQMLKKLKVYPGASHPHVAQKPEKLDLGV